MGCQLLRPDVRPAARHGARRHRPPRSARRRARPGRGLRDGAGHRGPCPARARGHRDRGRRKPEDGRRDPQARHHRVQGRPRRADPRRAGRRDPLDRDVPLDPRSRAALRPPVRGAEAGRQTRRAVRRRRERRQRPGRDRRRRPSRPARVGGAVELRDAGTDDATPAARGLQRRLGLAAALAGRAAGPEAVLHDRDPRLAPRAAARPKTASRSWTRCSSTGRRRATCA